MKRIYTLLFNLTLISSYSIAKPSKIDSKYESDQQSESFSSINGKKVNYTIKSGDTLLAIAREHYTTRAEIRVLNKMKEGEKLKLGRVLTVPTHTFYPKNVLVKHPIIKGDTLYTIAKKYHTTTAEICTVNSITKKTNLKLGQILKVPTNTYKASKKSTTTNSEKSKIIEYAIKSGDTLFKVAKKHNSTSKEIGKLNGLGKNDNLKIGMIIKVPIDTYIKGKKTSTSKQKISDDTSKEVQTKLPLTIASVVNQEKQKSIDLAKAKEAEEKIKKAEAKAKALKIAIAQRELEEQSILDRAETIKKKREERAIAEAKAEKTRIAAAKKAQEEKAKAQEEKAKAEAEKARIAKLKAEAQKRILEAKKKAEEEARQAKIQAEKEAKERVRQAKIKANKLEKERLQKLLDAENAKLAKIKKEMEELEKQAKIKEDLLSKAKEKIKQAKIKADAISEPNSTKKSSIEKAKSLEKEEEKKRKEEKKKEEKKKKEESSKKESAKNSLKTPTTIVTNSNKVIDYTVKKGDNLYKIAKAHHTTTIEVRDANKFRSNSDLVVGKMIKVPIDTYFHLKNYKIRSGDTLYKIARKHNTTTSRVLLANKMNRKSKLIKGDLIKVPVDTFSIESDIDTVRVASNTNTFKKKVHTSKKIELPQYKIQAGDTLYTIAKNSKTSVKKLKQLNKIKSNKDLKIGKFITLPKGKKVVKIKLAKQNSAVRVRKNKEEKVVITTTKKNKNFESFMDSLGGNSGRKALPRLAKKHLGKRYVWGATGPYRFDCSGFTSYVCKKNGVCLPRTSISQSKVGKYVSRRNLVAGDLIFFDTSKRRKGYVNHVGIYIGNNKFIHASSAKKKVVVTSLNKPFYKSRFKWGRRVDM